jgi:hypothetical protein
MNTNNEIVQEDVIVTTTNNNELIIPDEANVVVEQQQPIMDIVETQQVTAAVVTTTDSTSTSLPIPSTTSTTAAATVITSTTSSLFSLWPQFLLPKSSTTTSTTNATPATTINPPASSPPPPPTTTTTTLATTTITTTSKPITLPPPSKPPYVISRTDRSIMLCWSSDLPDPHILLNHKSLEQQQQLPTTNNTLPTIEYEIRYARFQYRYDPWSPYPITTTNQWLNIEKLTPGTTFIFHVRARHYMPPPPPTITTNTNSKDSTTTTTTPPTTTTTSSSSPPWSIASESSKPISTLSRNEQQLIDNLARVRTFILNGSTGLNPYPEDEAIPDTIVDKAQRSVEGLIYTASAVGIGGSITQLTRNLWRAYKTGIGSLIFHPDLQQTVYVLLSFLNIVTTEIKMTSRDAAVGSYFALWEAKRQRLLHPMNELLEHSEGSMGVIESEVPQEFMNEVMWFFPLAGAVYRKTPAQIQWVLNQFPTRQSGGDWRLVAARCLSEKFKPSFMLVVNEKKKIAVFSIRGTSEVDDLVTDGLCDVHTASFGFHEEEEVVGSNNKDEQHHHHHMDIVHTNNTTEHHHHHQQHHPQEENDDVDMHSAHGESRPTSPLPTETTSTPGITGKESDGTAAPPPPLQPPRHRKFHVHAGMLKAAEWLIQGDDRHGGFSSAFMEGGERLSPAIFQPPPSSQENSGTSGNLPTSTNENNIQDGGGAGVGAMVAKLYAVGYNEIIFTGHSMGAGVATLAALLLADRYRQLKIKVYGYGTPACVDEQLAEACKGPPHRNATINTKTSKIIPGLGHRVICKNVICHDDIIPRLSLKTATDFACELKATKDKWGPLLNEDINSFMQRIKTVWAPNQRALSLVRGGPSERVKSLGDVGSATTTTTTTTTTPPQTSSSSTTTTTFVQSVVTPDPELIRNERLKKSLAYRLAPPGLIAHTYKHHGTQRISLVDYNFPALRRIEAFENCIEDHRFNSILDAVRSAAVAKECRRLGRHPPHWESLSDHIYDVEEWQVTCRVCKYPVSWCNTSSSEASEVRATYHCHACGMIVCAACCENKVPLPSIGILQQVRVCDICIYKLGVQELPSYWGGNNSSNNVNNVVVGEFMEDVVREWV